MMKAQSKQSGFTLIEIMVVVFIIAIMAGLSFLALNQASDRRYTSQAEDFLSWLEQLSDMAMLEGTAYGIFPDEEGLQAVVFFNYGWYRVSTPEPFRFQDEVALSLMNGEGVDASLINKARGARGNVNAAVSPVILPDIIMLPDGYMEPDLDLSLAFENFSPLFKYHQNDEGISLVLERGL